MLRFVSLVLLTAPSVVLAVPRAVQASPSSICEGYMWGVTIQQLDDTPIPVYNQYVINTACAGPAWVESSTVSTPPSSISPWGTKYDCEVPEMFQYYCGNTRVATCCGNSTTPAQVA